MRHDEYTIGYDGVAKVAAAPALQAQRERIVLYALVYGLAPRYAMEIGAAKGGSAAIISAALDDVRLGGKLLSMDPHPELVAPETAAQVKHNCSLLAGFFPDDLPSQFDGQPTKNLFEFVFYDAEHTRLGIREHMKVLPRYMKPGAHLLCHDGYNKEQAKGMAEAVRAARFIDCGMLTRCANDSASLGEVYGGMRLFKVPGELPPNSGEQQIAG